MRYSSTEIVQYNVPIEIINPFINISNQCYLCTPVCSMRFRFEQSALRFPEITHTPQLSFGFMPKRVGTTLYRSVYFFNNSTCVISTSELLYI